MNLKKLRANFVEGMTPIYGEEEAFSFFYLLTDKFLNLRRVDVALQLNKELDVDQIYTFEVAINRLKNQEPIQYIIGDTFFYGSSFSVTTDVLIPRPETEELVDWIISDLKGNEHQNTRIIDIGTGSGCIAISLAKNIKNSKVTALDVSKKALQVARANAESNEVDIDWRCEDVLILKTLNHTYDIIVSNPPYVRVLEKEQMRHNVLEHEPHLALFVSDADPLVFYEKITELAKEALVPTGALYFEINQYLGQETKKMILSKGFSLVELRKDMFGNDRMIKAVL